MQIAYKGRSDLFNCFSNKAAKLYCNLITYCELYFTSLNYYNLKYKNIFE